jgi:uncharacterized protein YbjT (DUF2867 family)
MIVITAPTGNIGHQVLDRVLSAGRAPVRVVVRDPGKLPDAVRERVEVVAGSHGDPAVLDAAFAGAEAVFWLLPPDRRAATADDAYSGFTRPAAEALRAHAVPRVVDVTALGHGTPWAGRAGHVTASLAMDDLIAGTGAAFRALALPGFMDNLLRQTRSIKEQGTFVDVLPADLRLPAVATRDIAAVAARLLLDGSWAGQERVPLLGPEDVSYADMAAVVSDVLGTPVSYRRIPQEALQEHLIGAGLSQGMARAMLEMMTAKENGIDAEVVRTPQHALDTPTTFRQWCEEVLRPAVLAA